MHPLLGAAQEVDGMTQGLIQLPHASELTLGGREGLLGFRPWRQGMQPLRQDGFGAARTNRALVVAAAGALGQRPGARPTPAGSRPAPPARRAAARQGTRRKPAAPAHTDPAALAAARTPSTTEPTTIAATSNPAAAQASTTAAATAEVALKRREATTGWARAA